MLTHVMQNDNGTDDRSDRADHPLPDLVGLPEVMERTGFSRSTVYRLIADGDFPRPTKIGRRSIRWHREDYEDWLLAQRRRAPVAVA